MYRLSHPVTGAATRHWNPIESSLAIRSGAKHGLGLDRGGNFPAALRSASRLFSRWILTHCPNDVLCANHTKERQHTICVSYIWQTAIIDTELQVQVRKIKKIKNLRTLQWLCSSFHRLSSSNLYSMPETLREEKSHVTFVV